MGVSEVQQHIFLPFYHLLVMTATTEAYKSMRNAARWPYIAKHYESKCMCACMCAILYGL